jgi:hypothetical protein
MDDDDTDQCEGPAGVHRHPRVVSQKGAGDVGIVASYRSECQQSGPEPHRAWNGPLPQASSHGLRVGWAEPPLPCQGHTAAFRSLPIANPPSNVRRVLCRALTLERTRPMPDPVH